MIVLLFLNLPQVSDKSLLLYCKSSICTSVTTFISKLNQIICFYSKYIIPIYMKGKPSKEESLHAMINNYTNLQKS